MRSQRSKGVVDEAYKDWIQEMPCFICEKLGIQQVTITEAAHTGRRGMSQLADDSTCIPLCMEHHREGKDAHHKRGKHFASVHDFDMELLVQRLNEQYKEQA